MDTESVTTSSLFLSSFSTFAAGSLQVPPPLSVDLLSRGSPLPTPPSSLLASKLIPNTRFVVDGFRAAGDFSISYFLSHYHSDHYNGLNPNWCRGIIFCSEITARFLVEILKVSSLFVCHLPLNRSITIDGNNVILVDANHCPGAVQFLFEVGAEKYIHTGDFRFRDSMKLDPFLQKFVGAEAVFLDTTYCNPKFVFPPQEESVDYVVNTIRRIKEENQASSEHVLFLVATYVIGKERILLEIAKRCNCRLYADDRKMEILSILGFHDSGAFTDDASGTDIHVIGWNLLGDVWPYFRPNFVKMTDIMVEKGYSKAVGFISTGWVYEMRKGRFSVKIKDSLEIHLVPYSEHSSYDELREYVRFLRPKRVIPTVGRDAEKMDGRHLGSLQKHFSGLVDETANKHTFLLPFHQNEVIADAKSGSFNPASMNQPVDSVFSLIGEEECPLREVVMKEGNLQTAMEDLCNFLPSWVDEDQILSLIMDAGGDVIQAVSEFYDREIEFFKHSNSSALPAPDSQTNLANDFSPYLDLKFTEGTQSLCNGSMSHCNNKTIGKPNLVNSYATKRKVLGIDKKTKKNKKFSNSSSCGSKQSTITKFFGKFVATSADDAGSVMVSSQDSLNEVKHNIVATAEPYRHELDLFLQVTNNGIERNAAASLMEKAKGDIDVALDLYYCDPFHVVDKEDTLMRRSASGFVNALSCSRHPRSFRAKNPDAPGMSNFGASTVDSSVVKVLLPIEKYLPIEHACWKAGEPAPYLHLARTFEIAEQEKGKIKTAAMFCNMFRSLLALSPADVLPAVYLCTNRIAADHENMELNIGGALVIAALEEACGTNKSRIKEMYNSFGDLGDVAQECRQTQKLLALPCPLSIQHVFQMLRKISVEVGGGSTLRSRFANGSVVIRMDDTNVLSTVSSAKTDGSRDFLPLTVDYQEKQYAQGVIPTTFMRREGAPKERELLCGRLIDRPIRPLFPAGFYHEVQVMVNVLSSDGKQDPDVMAANATSAALMLSDIPWGGPIGMIRVGRIDGQFVFNPTMDELSSSDLNLVYACTRDKTLMIDVQAREVSEADLEAALKLAHPEAVKYIDPQIRLAQRAGKMKKEYTVSMIMNKAVEKIRNYVEEPIEAVFTDATYGKFERGEALDRITEGVRVKIEEEFDEECLKALPKVVDNIRKQVVRKRIIEKGLRVDGRKLDEVRPLYCESGTYPILHGSSIFSRGDTQVLCTVTIGAPGDAQKLDSLVGPPTKRFMLHYSFPPFCINEVGKRIGLNRREVGHGTLAEKALLAVLPPEDDFKYTVRINSEVMSSDGSTSMATVCGGSMALMDAGIPVREHVAGLSVGLVSEVDPTTGIIKDYRILTDILGLEDHLGDMDFKIAGTKNGITAIQLDIKPAGIPLNIICECLGVARKGRIQILDRMEEEISAPRSMNDGNAPRLATMKLDEESLRRLLGPLGLHRKKIEKETGARIAVSDGIVTIVAKNHIIMEKAQQKVDFLVGREIQVGRIYKGIVSSIKEYGAFVELNGGQQGLLHISELSHELPSKVSDAVSVGQELSVMCIGQDVRGNIKLSLKATLPPLRGSINLSAGSSDVSFCAEGGNLNVSKTETDIENAAYSTPSIIIRSAAECETQDGAKTWNSTEKTSRKSLPKPYNPVSSQSGTVGFGRFNSNVSPEQKAANLLRMAHIKKERDSISVDVYKQESEECTSKYKTKSSGMANHQNNSLKLGDKVTAKIYQIRTHGLVLEVGGGLRGMYKFEANGRKDFEVGEMILAKCSSFSDKGIPVFSLFEDKS